MIKLGLRLRIAATIAVACIAVVAALGVAIYMASEDLEGSLVEQIVAEELDFLIRRHRSNPAYVALAPGPNLQYYVVRTPEDEARLPPALRALGPGQHEIDFGHGAGDRHVAVGQAGATRFIVVYDVVPHEEREQRFKQLLLLSLATVIVVALALGYWLAGMLTRQLTELAQRVSVLAPDEPHAPLSSREQDQEVAALARALDQYHARIVSMIRREQEFAANASHELRTPLTAIRTSCELLLTEPDMPEKTRSRVRMIEAAAARMGEQLQILLFLAREQALGTAEPVALKECVNDAAEPLRAEIARNGLLLDVAIDPGAVIDLNRQALHTVLINLLRNAVQHTKRGFIRVSFSGRRLTVSDSGAGILPAHLPHIFERFHRGNAQDEGMGLGLAIVKRICDQAGWKIEVASAPDTGSAFSITFS